MDSFTNPNNSTSAQSRPQGQGDNGETWDPIQKRWVPANQMPAQPVESQGPGLPQQDSYGFARYGGGASGEIVKGYGKERDNSRWGGYGGTWVPGPDGKPVLDTSQGGASADANRYSGLAYNAQNQGAYQNNYQDADSFAALGLGARAGQEESANLAKNVARYGDAQSQALGRNMLQQGAQAQQAAALSARGGALGGAAALQQQRGGLASYLQKGNLALEAQKADDMARGRSEYMDAANAMRSQDMTAQGLNQGQAISQGENEMAQRRTNDALEKGYEGLRFGTLAADQAGRLKDQATQAGVYTTNVGADVIGHNAGNQAATSAASSLADIYKQKRNG